MFSFREGEMHKDKRIAWAFLFLIFILDGCDPSIFSTRGRQLWAPRREMVWE
jgi:hypothetical protein